MGAADFSLTPWQSLLFLLLFTLLLNIDNSTTTIEIPSLTAYRGPFKKGLDVMREAEARVRRPALSRR